MLQRLVSESDEPEILTKRHSTDINSEMNHNHIAFRFAVKDVSILSNHVTEADLQVRYISSAMANFRTAAVVPRRSDYSTIPISVYGVSHKEYCTAQVDTVTILFQVYMCISL